METTLQPLVLAVLPLMKEGTGELRLGKHVSLPELVLAAELRSLTMLQDHSGLL